VLLLPGKNPFGLEMKSDDPSSLVSYVSGDKNNYLFNGKEDQLQTGMYDYGARQYDPATARWYANDKLGNRPEQIDKSPYAYAWNNPVNLKDPDGNCPVCIIAAIGGAINVATHWNKIMSGGHPLRDGFAAFGIGAVAGTVAALTGGTALLAEGGATLSLASIGNAAAIGAYSGASSSLVQGVGNAVYFNDPYSPADFVSAAVLGGVTGGIAKGVEALLAGGTAPSGLGARGGPGVAKSGEEAIKEIDGNLNSNFNEVAQYVNDNGNLPSTYISKADAKVLGWNAKLGNLNEVAPNKSIGGDIFRNIENKLPSSAGRVWYEADINYFGGFRGGERLLYSNDGLFYKTLDHYKSFIPVKL